LLQVQGHATIDSIDDCNLPTAKGAVIARSHRRRSNLDDAETSGARLLPRESCPRVAMTAKAPYRAASRAAPRVAGETRCGARDLGLTRQPSELRGAGPVFGWRAISCRARSSP
jgi:hypothetical protein